MSERVCVECGYDLSGLPAEGTVVTCPECAHANDLSISLMGRVTAFRPLLWAMVPGAMAAMFAEICQLASDGNPGSMIMVTRRVGVFAGTIATAVLVYRALGRDPGMRRAPRLRWTRLVWSVLAAVGSFSIWNIVAAVVVMVFLLALRS